MPSPGKAGNDAKRDCHLACRAQLSIVQNVSYCKRLNGPKAVVVAIQNIDSSSSRVAFGLDAPSTSCGKASVFKDCTEHVRWVGHVDVHQVTAVAISSPAGSTCPQV